MGQEGIVIQYGAQREYQLVSSDLTLDKFDTGKLLVISGAVEPGVEAGALTCSLPAVSAVEKGFNVLIAVASDHSHSIDGGATSMRGILLQSPPFMGVAYADLDGASGIKVNSGINGDPRGTLIEIFCDGTLWHVRGSSTSTLVAS